MPNSVKIRRILIADDDHLISETLKQILSNGGYSAKAVYSGEEAIEMARLFEPDLFITDFMMPGISGIEAAKEIQSFLPSCQVILVSGAIPNMELIPGAHHRSVNLVFMAKPVSPEALLRRIAEFG